MYTPILDKNFVTSKSEIYRFTERSLLSTKVKNFLVYTHCIFYVLAIILLLRISLVALAILLPIAFLNASPLSLLNSFTNSHRGGKTTLISLKHKSIEFHRHNHPQICSYSKIKVFILNNNKVKIIVKYSFPITLKYYGTLDKIFPSSKVFFEQLERNGVKIIHKNKK
jgi:hypothetical protein